jgi:hypothetical protein
LQPTGLIYLSAVAWDYTRQREHELARGLAGFLPTLFVNPPTLRALRTGQQSSPAPAGEGLWTLDTFTPAVGYRNLHALNVGVRRGLLRQIRHAAGGLGFRNPIVVVDDVGYWPIIEQLGASLVVFDCVDRPWVFARVASVRLLKSYFYAVARRADMILASSRNLQAELSAINPRVELVLNAGDYEHFSRARDGALPIPEDLAPIPEPRLVTMGVSFAPRTDFAMVRNAALARPDWQFVFVGTTAFPQGFDCPPNIHALGEKPYASLPSYMAHTQVCLAPYGLHVGWDYAFPKKLFEYLATGRPTVMNPLPEVVPYSEVVRTPTTDEEFICAIEAALAEWQDPESYGALAARRQAVARENTWEQRVAAVVEALRSRMEGGGAA